MTTIHYLAPDALLELKSSSRRDKDILDVAALRALMSGTEIARGVDLHGLTPAPGSVDPEAT